MQPDSKGNEFIRWELPSFVTLRNGQQAFYEALKTKSKNVYTIQLPTGYGKSWCACIAYATLRSQARVNKALFVVPTDTQCQQYIEGLVNDLKALRIPFKGIEKCSEAWVIKKSLKNQSDIFVTTVQKIGRKLDYFLNLMSQGNWLVVADEFHHYGEDNSWGKAIKSLNYSVLLGMSATPLRGDRRQTIFGEYDFDVVVSIQEAAKEGAIRQIAAIPIDYRLTWGTDDDDEPQTATMKELQESIPQEMNISEWELKKRVRYFRKYVSSIFVHVLNKWLEYESIYPEQNQILVFAMTCKHAESVAKTINELACPGLPEPFADWIGTGEGATESRTPEQNLEILEKFQANKLKCLVQVNKAGEGFNNKRCSIGVFLDLIGDNPTKRQHIGRFMRINSASPDLNSVIFLSEDHPALPLVENLSEQTNPQPSNKKESCDREPFDPTDYAKIDDLIIIDAQENGTRLVYPYGLSKEEAIESIQQSCPELDGLTSQQIEEVLDRWAKKQPENKPLSSEEIRQQMAEQVTRNTGIVVNVYIAKRFGRSFPKSAKTDAFKAIHGYYKRRHGGQDELTENELKIKNHWLKSLLAQIKKGELPTWLM